MQQVHIRVIVFVHEGLFFVKKGKNKSNSESKKTCQLLLTT